MTKNTIMQAALGEIPFDLAILDAQLVNVTTGEIYPVDVGIWEDRIAYVRPAGERKMQAEEIIHAENRFLAPGLIDTHVHIESSMLTPQHFAASVLPHGTTTVIIDPHEIANVLGMEGVRYMLEASQSLPLRVCILVPSCVPAVPAVETSGAVFGAKEISEMLSWERVIGLAEVMDYPGVVASDKRMVDILESARQKKTLICGHCMHLTGADLQAYIAAGPDSDHEVMDKEEMMDKIRSGMTIEAHESFHSSNIEILVQNLNKLPLLPTNVTFCIDDLPAYSLLEDGHIDRVLRKAVLEGLSPVKALRIATLHAALRCRLPDLGVVAPGKKADMVLFDDLENFHAHLVICDGKVTAKEGKLTGSFLNDTTFAVEKKNTVKLNSDPTGDDFVIPCEGAQREVNVIEFTEGILTRFVSQKVPARNGLLDWQQDPALSLVAVFERHGVSGHHSLGLLKDFGLSSGAIASTIAHDSHNLIVAGRDIADMTLAVNTLIQSGGGLVCVENNTVIELVELPVAGLLSLLPAEELAEKLKKIKDAIVSLGVGGREPLLKITGLALPVIPDARISDQGLVDVGRQSMVPLFVD